MATHNIIPELAYPIDFRWFSEAVLTGKKGRLTPDGALSIYYGPYVGWQRYATSQAILSLGLIQLWLDTKNEETLALLRRVVNSLLPMAQGNQTGMMGFPISFKPLGYRLETPWYSGLTQGFCASVFARMHILTSDKSWLEHSKASLDFVIETPGLACNDSSGGVWYEEAPTAPPPHILNGHIYCAIAFLEVGRLSNDQKYTKSFQDGVFALKENLSAFEMPNGLSYYDAIRKIPAQPYYQKLHVEQLRYLSATTGYDIFATYADRWEKRASEKWSTSAWFQYFKRSTVSGIRSDGIGYPMKALFYALGDLGLRSR